MCTGLEIAAISAIAGGTALQNSSQRAKTNAYNENAGATARLQEQQEQAAWDAQRRQHDLERQRRDAYEAVVPAAERDSREGALEDATATRAELMREVSARPEDGDAYYSGATGEQGSGPRVVRDHADLRREEADDFVGLMGNARARLGAWDESQLPLNTAMVDGRFNIGELARQSRSDYQLTNEEQRMRMQRAQELARQSQAAYDTTGNKRAAGGNLLTQVGTMAMMKGGGGSPGANYQGAGFGGVSGSFSQDYGSLGKNFYNSSAGAY